ncbi:MAG TPA: efflux RND transporter periplasmic adaptor subunit [Dongiaceae bacterium]|nr:efflux RND transporter periplasmic adaptor subunit [Dongiaceae bacterium]
MVIAGGVAALHYFQRETAAPAAVAQAPKAVPVTVVPVVQKPAPVEISTVGRVQTQASVAVRSRIDGVISAVSIADGQEVKAGDELFRIDDREAQAALKQAQANLGRDQAQLVNAQRELARLTPLAAKNFTTKQDLDTAGTNVATLQATIAADQAAIDAAKVTLSYTIIRAPISGRIGTIALKLGSSVRAADSTPLVTINQLQPILVAYSISQEDMGELQKAMAAGPVVVRARVPDSSAPVQQGTVSYVENAIDPATNTLSVKAVFPNADEFLWPSQFVNVTMIVRTDPNALVVPSVAVQISQDGPYVWVLKPDKTVEMRNVTVARQLGDETVLADGVTAGEQVVTEGQLRLEPGTKVDAAPPTTAPTAEKASPTPTVTVEP